MRYSKGTDDASRLNRLAFLQKRGINTDLLRNASLGSEDVKSNIENYIGSISIPVGIAGPLSINENMTTREIFVALATTEGALVASVNRGAKAISLSGGFSAQVTRQVMLRSPIFSFHSMAAASEFSDFIKSNFGLLKGITQKYSHHAVLKGIETELMGKDLHTSFLFETGDASGQNMTTTCTWHCCLWLEENYIPSPSQKILEFVLDGNSSSDKKISYSSIHRGRGMSVVSETIIKEDVIRSVFKTTSTEMLKWYRRAQPMASLDGMIGLNINVANLIAGVFTATGQDIACVHESAFGVLFLEEHAQGLYATLKLPRLVIGTVGGGTGLPHQKTMLNISGVAGAGKVKDFAKLISGFALSLELSTIAAFVNGQFAIAHERLGKNRPIEMLSPEETHGMVHRDVLRSRFFPVTFKGMLDKNNGILTRIAREHTSKPVGFSLWEAKEGSHTKSILLKNKPLDRDVFSAMTKLTGLIDPSLSKAFGIYQNHSEFKGSQNREIEIYAFLAQKGYRFMPEFFGSHKNDSSETYCLAIEYLDPKQQRIMNAENSPEEWHDDAVLLALYAVGESHELLTEAKLDSVSFQNPAAICKFAKEALQTLRDEDESDPAILNLIENCVEQYSTDWHQSQAAEALRVVVHNDFNPRNVALTQDHHIQIYDWELATLQYPARDAIEFISFLTPSRVENLWQNHLKTSQENHLRKHSQISLDDFDQSIRMAFIHFVLTRVTVYLLGNSFTNYLFLPRVCENLHTLAAILGVRKTMGASHRES